jgi:hypothetical protein
MSENKDKLDLDLNFLNSGSEDSAVEEKNGERTVQNKKRQTANEPNWSGFRTFAIIVAVIVGIIWFVRSNENTNNNLGSRTAPASAGNRQSTPPAYPSVRNDPIAGRPDAPPESGNTVTVGSFRCSRSVASQADRLLPNSINIEAEKIRISTRWQNLDNYRAQLESRNPGSSSSQYMIDQFNSLVRQYNSQLTALQGDSAILQTKIDQFNSQITAYNQYLTSNCTRVAR